MTSRRRSRVLAPAAAIAVALALAGLVAVLGRDREQVDERLPFQEGVLAIPSDDFADSIGINTHLHYKSSPYEEFESVKRVLSELGIRHIRDYPVPANAEKVEELSGSGIRLTAIMGTATPQQWMPHDLEELHQVVREIRPAIAAVEGVNEWDNTDDPDWAENLRKHQQSLWEVVREDAVTADLPILAPSLTWARNMDDVGDLSPWSDFGNIHPYPGGREPERRVLDDMEVNRRTVVTDETPVMATETGYHNAVGNGRGHPGVSEDVAAVYLPRLFLHYFALGIPRTFTYELIDQEDNLDDREGSFGLVRNDFSKKPAFFALQHLIALLADPGPQFHPGRLDYRITGGDGDTRHLLLQKRDGTFFLALWQADPIWDANQEQPAGFETRPITIELTQPVALARVWEVGDIEGAPRVIERPNAIDLEADPAVQLLELVPQLNAPS